MPSTSEAKPQLSIHNRARLAFECRLWDAIRAGAEETAALVAPLEAENAQLKAAVASLKRQLAEAEEGLATWKRSAVEAHRELRDLKSARAA